MSKPEQNNIKWMILGLGLPLGATVGIIFSFITNNDIARSMIIGAAIGLILGSVLFGFITTKEQD